MTTNRMPACLEREIFLSDSTRYEELITHGRVIGLHFYDELYCPYENRGLSASIAVAWRGSVCYVAAPMAVDEDGNPYHTPSTYAAPYEERVAAAVEGIRKLEADYQKRLNDYDRSR